MTMTGTTPHYPRYLKAWLLRTAVLALLVAPALASAQDYTVAPEPDWILRDGNAPPNPGGTGEVPGGVRYHFVDRQIRVGTEGPARYYRQSTEILNRAGAEQVSQISIEFEPSYQRVTLHRVELLRNGQVLDQLDRARIEVLQREPRMEALLYDGRKTVHLVVDDVRIGDVLTYSYTVQGSNPVFGGRFYTALDMQWAVPVERLRVRLLKPIPRQLSLTLHGDAPEPRLRPIGGEMEALWERRGLPALIADNGLPRWFDPYPWVQVSEAASWSEVVEWAAPLYASAVVDPSVEDQARRLAAGATTDEERLLAVLRFVQEDVRYLGKEIGAHSHAPSPAGKVLERRFGDCKDKTVLMLGMLRVLDIDAAPALVNTRVGRTVAGYKASPLAFDHVLVRARVGGHTYWLDPTLSDQGRSLATIYQPDHGVALVIAPDSTVPVPMRSSVRVAAGQEVVESYDFRGGIDRAGTFMVQTVHTGAQAEIMRTRVASEGIPQIQKGFLDFYSGYYPGIVTGSPMEVEDDPRTNRLTVREHYRFAEGWALDAASGLREMDFHPVDLYARLEVPASAARRTPLGIGRPFTLSARTTVHLPGEWNIEPAQTNVEDAAFSYHKQLAYTPGRVQVEYRYRQFADHVSPELYEDYVRNVQLARDSLGLRLFRKAVEQPGVEPGYALNWMMVFAAFATFVGAMLAAALLYRYDPAPPPGEPIARLTGIRGWLFLPLIGLMLSPLRLLMDLREASAVFDLETWESLTVPGSAAYDVLWAPALVGSMCANIVFMVFALLLLVLFFQRRTSLPRLYLIWVVLGLVISVADLMTARLIPAAAEEITAREWGGLGGQFTGSTIWFLYFLISKRVRSTFTRRRRRATRQEVEPHAALESP